MESNTETALIPSTSSNSIITSPDLPNGVHTNGKEEKVKIPLPKHIYYVDMRELYDEELMKRFYNDLMIPNFPLADELDSLEYMQGMLMESRTSPDDESGKKSPAVDFHVLMMIAFADKPKTDPPNYMEGTIMGGVVFEYYIQANVGLLTYLLVSSKWRGAKLGFVLAEKCRESLETNAKSRGHLAGCNAIFLETNSATKVQASNDVMPPAMRHGIFYKMGLRLVDFDYIQAPLDNDKKKVNYLLLCCFITPRIPSIKVGNEVSYYLPSTLLRNTIHAFWSNAPIKGRKFADDVDYKRMNDQLGRRERIFLLDLPWERPFTIVDLKEHFDLELLVEFYQDLLVPCYRDRQEELDSLDVWLELLSPKHKTSKNPDLEFHLLLALKYSEDEEENSKPMIAGGLSFEYYPGNNCGFITYLLVPMGERGERMARALIDSALEELDTDAKHRGQLGGCNVIFMESRTSSATDGSSSRAPGAPNNNTNAGVVATKNNLDIQDIEQQHPLLESMGWKMVDFDYVQPSNADPTKKVKSMFLMCFVTPRIPMLLQEEMKYLYLPRSTLKKFIQELWEISCQRFPGYDYKTDRDYLDMMDQLERRPRIPLLGRPWNKPWTLIDLQENNNTQIMKQFYTEFLEPRIPKEDLEPLDNFQRRLAANNANAQVQPELFHVLMATKPTMETNNYAMLGGLVFKYFESTNCGFITHALLKSDNRDLGLLAKALAERAVDILDQDAVARGNLAGCNAIFLETSDQNREQGLSKTVVSIKEIVDISLQHSMLHKLGWRLVDFNYVAPPSRPGRKPMTHRSLALFLTNRIPRVYIAANADDAYHYLPRTMLTSFMQEYWRVSCASSGYDFDQDPEFVSMMDLIQRRERIPLLDLPWERPWTLVDLWEDFDAQLLYKFYQNFYVTSFPDKADREPLSKWLQLLSNESRDDPSVEDFHVLLALQYPAKTSKTPQTPTILGGILFTYYTSISCGLLTYMSVPPNGDVMAKNLLEEATVSLNENAVLRGHIAGCNAIFMENPIKSIAGNNISHELLYKAGWRLLTFSYYQPPLSIHSNGGLPWMLLALLTPNIPKEQQGNTASYSMPKDLLKSFLWNHWRESFMRIGKQMVTKDTCYQKMMSSVESSPRISLADLPWHVNSQSKL